MRYCFCTYLNVRFAYFSPQKQKTSIKSKPHQLARKQKKSWHKGQLKTPGRVLQNVLQIEVAKIGSAQWFIAGAGAAALSNCSAQRRGSYTAVCAQCKSPPVPLAYVSPLHLQACYLLACLSVVMVATAVSLNLLLPYLPHLNWLHPWCRAIP
jgi:hypothetical protein